MGRLTRLGTSAGKWTAWGRLIAAAEVLLIVKRHVDNLRPGEIGELRSLLAKSKGKPSNLSDKEKGRLKEIVKKLEPGLFAREAGSKAMPFVRKK